MTATLRLWKDFYPRPPRGGRSEAVEMLLHIIDFYPRPPRGGRFHEDHRGDCVQLFLSTPSARRAIYLLTVPPTSIKISIHALREEGDMRTSGPAA